MMTVVVTGLVLVIVLFVLRSLGMQRRRPKYTYIKPVILSHPNGWIRVRHTPGWVRNRLLNAPESYLEQGVHNYPYCRGRHFEYVFDGNNVYKRKFYKIGGSKWKHK